MDFEEFALSLSAAEPPAGLKDGLLALWYDAKGDWDQAHTIAQEMESLDGALIHGYLHRKEGDNGNARYWYARAGASFPSSSLEAEWREISQKLLLR